MLIGTLGELPGKHLGWAFLHILKRLKNFQLHLDGRLCSGELLFLATVVSSNDLYISKTAEGIEPMDSHYKEMISLQKDRNSNQCSLFITLSIHALNPQIVPINTFVK